MEKKKDITYIRRTRYFSWQQSAVMEQAVVNAVKTPQLKPHRQTVKPVPGTSLGTSHSATPRGPASICDLISEV